MRDRELAGLAMTLGRDNQMSITVGGDHSYCTPDGDHIHIARMPATELGLQLMVGLVHHEVGHKRFTQGSKPPGLLGELMNVIEDVRVEQASLREHPGACFDLEAVTAHYVGKGSLHPRDVPTALLGLVMAYGRSTLLGQTVIAPLLPACQNLLLGALGSSFVTKLETLLFQDFPCLTSTEETQVLASKIIDLLVCASPSCEEQSPKEDSTPDRHPNQAQPTAAAIEQMLIDGCGGYGDLSQLMTAEMDEMARQTPATIRADVPELPAVGRRPKGATRLDEVDALATSSQLRARLLTLLQSLKFPQQAVGRSGRKLASNRLVSLALGDARIFKKKVPALEVHTAVMILLDLSGSMAFESTPGHNRCTVANAAAFALHHALYGLAGVKVASAEFSSRDDERPEVNLLADFGEKPDSAVFNQTADGGTPTHSALWAARAALLHRYESRKIILILTDGEPCEPTRNQSASRHCLNDGIEIAAIGILSDAVKHYWDHHRVITSLQELPTAMFGAMEALLRKNRG